MRVKMTRKSSLLLYAHAVSRKETKANHIMGRNEIFAVIFLVGIHTGEGKRVGPGPDSGAGCECPEDPREYRRHGHLCC